MAMPATRQELIDHCLRRLGSPVLEVNVDDDQIEDKVDDAIQLYNCIKNIMLMQLLGHILSTR